MSRLLIGLLGLRVGFNRVCGLPIRGSRARSAKRRRGWSMPTRSSCRTGASRTSSPPSTAARPATACCRSRTRSAAASTATTTCCVEHELPIVGEVELPVVHHLLALPGVALGDVRRVYSHPQALAQCERFLRTLTGVEIIATYDTAGSAKMVADEKLARRRGDRLGARRAKCSASCRSPRPFRTSTTTSRASSSSAAGRSTTTPADKTTIVFTLPNEPGALFKALSVFALRGIDLTKLESRPIPGPALGVSVLRGRRRRRATICAARARSRIWPSSRRCCACSARIRAGRAARSSRTSDVASRDRVRHRIR